MNETPPQFIILAGPNGAGKSTSAPYLLPPNLTFINADEIAKQLAPASGKRTDIEAGRIALAKLDELERERKDFAIETTLASRSLAQRITRLREIGYQTRVIYLWISSADLAVSRVSDRVRRGGHNIPEEVVRRRYETGIRNMLNLYIPVADTWALYDNTMRGELKLIAQGDRNQEPDIRERDLWSQIYGTWKNR